MRVCKREREREREKERESEREKKKERVVEAAWQSINSPFHKSCTD